jgi:hypothetical protein
VGVLRTTDTELTTASAVALAGALLALTIAGCGGSGEPAKTVTVERQVTVEKQPAQRKHRRKSRPQPTPTTAAPEFVDCDPNIEARVATTTCPFAQNVFWTYWTSGESNNPLQVWSPAAHASFTTTCERGGAQVLCTTSDNAAVKFSQAALDRYSQSQADAYASSHDLGPDPYEGLPPTNSAPDGGAGGGGSEDCQGYDPCIPPGDDVDCASGSGNGPRYVDGPVYVSGSDPYGLDGDGDGVGCDYR